MRYVVMNCPVEYAQQFMDQPMFHPLTNALKSYLLKFSLKNNVFPYLKRLPYFFSWLSLDPPFLLLKFCSFLASIDTTQILSPNYLLIQFSS